MTEPTTHLATKTVVPAQTSLTAKLANMFVCPGDVFDEILTEPPRLANWLVPTVMVCLSSLVLLVTASSKEQTVAAVRDLVEAGSISAGDSETVSTRWLMSSGAFVCLSAFGGTFWSAFVLCFMGRVVLKTRFSLGASLGVAGLSGMILVLGTVVTALLVQATGNTAARPALSLFAGGLPRESSLWAAMDVLNVFHVWGTVVLAIGLSKLSGVSFREAALWVFAFWLMARLSLILLG